ncbi:MAG: hypothetical protein HC910_18675 [Spirulinaceae cyanobacterium SM2_1_0]|nr:hypothetical protein [Spirulinaceae cyanobacterium SM2_1_0]
MGEPGELASIAEDECNLKASDVPAARRRAPPPQIRGARRHQESPGGCQPLHQAPLRPVRLGTWHLPGGRPGATGRNWVQRRDGSVEELASTASVAMQPGDTFVIETPGGGGYGAAPEPANDNPDA